MLQNKSSTICYFMISFLLVISAISIAVENVYAGNDATAVSFQFDYIWFVEGGTKVANLRGTGEITTRDGKVIGKSDVTPHGNWVGIHGLKGAQFSYEPSFDRIAFIKKSKSRSTSYASLSYDRKKSWKISEENFIFLVPAGSILYHCTPKIDFAKSITRASLITLPSGNFNLFGYTVKCSVNGGTVKFNRGTIVESTGCKME